jgi:hypothetical protein
VASTFLSGAEMQDWGRPIAWLLFRQVRRRWVECPRASMPTIPNITNSCGTPTPRQLSVSATGHRTTLLWGLLWGPSVQIRIISYTSVKPGGMTRTLCERRSAHFERYRAIPTKTTVPLLTCKGSQVQVLLRPPYGLAIGQGKVTLHPLAQELYVSAGDFIHKLVVTNVPQGTTGLLGPAGAGEPSAEIS